MLQRETLRGPLPPQGAISTLAEGEDYRRRLSVAPSLRKVRSPPSVAPSLHRVPSPPLRRESATEGDSPWPSL